MRFLIDAQLPAALCPWLQDRGHPSQHVLDIQLAQGKDTLVWRYAEQHGLVIMTKDEDFAEWAQKGRRGPAVVWLRIGNSTNPYLFDWMDSRLAHVVMRLGLGDRLVEVR